MGAGPTSIKQAQKANIKKPTATMVSAAVRRGSKAAVDIAASPAPNSGVAAFSAFDLPYEATSTVVVASIPVSYITPTAAQLKVGDIKTAMALAKAQAGAATPIRMQVRSFIERAEGDREGDADSDSGSDSEPDMARVAAARAAMLKSAAQKQKTSKVGSSVDSPADVPAPAPAPAPVGAPAPASAPAHVPCVTVRSSVAAPTGPATGITPNNTSVAPATAAGSKNPMAYWSKGAICTLLTQSGDTEVPNRLW